MKTELVVIGAGHAGCEAAVAAARMGVSTVLLTINLDVVGQMSCNPAIGGLGKGQMVREIDALGGVMAEVIDRTGIQFRVLNRSRGPAVQGPRAQADKVMYRLEMRRRLEETPNLLVMQDVAVAVHVTGGRVSGVKLLSGGVLACRAVVMATGTFLGGQVFIGKIRYAAGRSNEPGAMALGECLRELGLPVIRLKTGTPPRVHRDSVDTSRMRRQDGDEIPQPFSFRTRRVPENQEPCWVTYTNEQTHQIIRDHMDESALFSGAIQGVGPRYCPSIEDKVRKFPDRERHQVFLEPESRYTAEWYVNGVSTSLPVGVQEAYLHTIPGLEHARIVRPGYAIEYDAVNPVAIGTDLQCRDIAGLFLAGQINGTSGYEEAAGQGLLAGINAVQWLRGEEPVVIGREQGYIGVMVDDIVREGVDEPYRMFSSRAEYRLLLDHRSADRRLMPIGHRLGLVSDDTFHQMEEKYAAIERYTDAAEKASLKEAVVDRERLAAAGIDPADVPSLAQLLRRPEIRLVEWLDSLAPEWQTEWPEDVDSRIKYAGYVARERERIARMERHRALKIPDGFDFEIPGIRKEVAERLRRARPENLDQASRIPGVTPAAVTILYVTLTKKDE